MLKQNLLLQFGTKVQVAVIVQLMILLLKVLSLQLYPTLHFTGIDAAKVKNIGAPLTTSTFHAVRFTAGSPQYESELGSEPSINLKF